MNMMKRMFPALFKILETQEAFCLYFAYVLMQKNIKNKYALTTLHTIASKFIM